MHTSNSLFKHKSLIFFTALLFIFTHAPGNAATTMANTDFELGDLIGRLCSENHPAVVSSIADSRKYSSNFALIQQIAIHFRAEVTLKEGGLIVVR